MAQRRQAQLCRWRGSRLGKLLDIGGDMHALDRRKLPYPSRGEPVEKFHGGARIGAARVRIADIGGEEFKEAIRRALADGGDESMGAVGEDDELVHCRFFHQHFHQHRVCRQSSFKSTLMPMKVGLRVKTSGFLSSDTSRSLRGSCPADVSVLLAFCKIPGSRILSR